VLAVVLIVSAIVVSEMSENIVDDTQTELSNTTDLNASGPAYTAASNKSHYTNFQVTNFGEWVNATLTTTIITNGTDTLNYSIWLNGNLIGAVGGYNVSDSYTITTTYLVNGVNNITYQLANSTNISQSDLDLYWEKTSEIIIEDIGDYGLAGLQEISSWLVILAIVIVASVIIAIVIKGFGNTSRR